MLNIKISGLGFLDRKGAIQKPVNNANNTIDQCVIAEKQSLYSGIILTDPTTRQIIQAIR